MIIYIIHHQREVEKTDIELLVNGETYKLNVEPRKTLADALRDDCRLTGTHLGCEHGVCGACTVLLDGEAVRSCLMFAVQVEDQEIRTIEGLAPTEDELHPLQRSFIEHHALQCGFCTPGFIMLAASVVERYPDVSEHELRELLSSNLCRCTGYVNILQAVRSTLDSTAEASGG